LETTGLSLQESTDILKNAIVELSVIWGVIGEKIYRKFQAVLKRNPGRSTLRQYTKSSMEKTLTLLRHLSWKMSSTKICTCDLARCGKVFFRPQKNSVWPVAIHDCWKHEVSCGSLCMEINT
jgi:hypothetical protein